ncbi:fimbrial protein [Aeromonas sp. CA23]|uniref:fimbrial protein n=1 Tax=Aeromonas sp. CA23 TaxID=2033032 RepID=UPI000BFDB0E0|nr:fimbrial protein [Aeromonas sp. CA23]ATL98232.1 fimbrial protein [Aeromonas sp. CA23]
MKNKYVPLLSILAIFCGNAVAEETGWSDLGPATPAVQGPVDQGHGTIKFVGAIIDAPCSIAPESVDQTVQMGEIANSLLNANGATPLRPFEIHLEACDITTALNATVTFDGIPFDKDKKSLALNGGGSGGAIALVNKSTGEDIVIGKPTKVASLVNGDNHLKFGAKVISTGKDVVTGEFDATSDFIMTYQ